MKKRVVITGIGPITGIGIGKREFFDNLLALKTNIREIPDEYEKQYKFKSGYYSPFPDFNLSDYVETRFENIMEKTSKLSVAGAKLAFEDARLNDFENASIVIGLGMGSLVTAFQSHIAHATEIKAAKYNRMVIPMQMPNAVSAWPSILFGIKGPNHTLNASCASGTIAIGEAYNKIARGECDTVIAGGVECLEDRTGSTMRGFDVLTALTKSADGLPRPFSRNRSGFLFSDGGGCIMILEEMEKACRRNAPIYAEISGFVSNSDSHNILQMEESGSQVISLLEKLVSWEKIDYINAHGTGTVNNDETEALAIQRVFGDAGRQPFINSTKGILGHSIGASGAIEAAVVAMSISESKIHGNLTGDIIGNLNVVQETNSADIAAAISLSFGFGGHNAGLLLKRFS